jgi:hypothetical protein
MSVTLNDQISCVRRELAWRQRSYPRMVETRAMTQAWADFQIAHMHEVLRTLERLQAQDPAQPALCNTEEVSHATEHARS